jgi:hypothetical protein
MMKAEYRISIAQKREGAQQSPGGPRSKLEIIQVALLTLLALSAVIGVFLAPFVLGSIIATVLLILIAISILAWSIRRLSLMFKRGQTKS